MFQHKYLLTFLLLLTPLTSCSGSNKSKNDYRKQAAAERTPEFPVDKLFIERWSPRAMSGEKIAEDKLMSLFEAARWAPSDSNNQSWRFIYAHRETPEWNTLFDCLVDFNKLWVKNAAVLVVIISKNTYDDDTPCQPHSFDAGAAWMSLALQGSMMGLVVHGLGGFDYDRARKKLAIPDDYTVEAMCSIGVSAPVDVLPERMRKGEVPSQRKPLAEIVFKGSFQKTEK